ncbi:MAG: hypothetical protein EBT79_08710 [Actinobacteria bacterium]|nr:hypothetical protein [Actinomycetota bacterium]
MVRGILRKVIAEVVKAVRASEEDEEGELEGEVGVALRWRLQSHPDLESYDVFPNEWGGYTVHMTMRGRDFATHAFEADEALARAVAFVWGDDG